MIETNLLPKPEPTRDFDPNDEKLLKEIRQRYKYALAKWGPIREDGNLNMQYISGDPWDPRDREERKKSGRPCVSHDELNQYVNQTVNNARQNPRGIKVDPAGNGATDKLAEYRQDRIRAIEYRCNAQEAYLTGFQAAVERNMGWWRVSREYVGDESNDQEIVIEAIENPDTIVCDPDYKKPNGSDMRYLFELDPMPADEFEAEYPDAEKRSFTEEDRAIAPEWISDHIVLLAGYWRVETETVESGGKDKPRKEKRRRIVQYITNGVEILDRIPQPGSYIPFAMVTGKVIEDPVSAETVIESAAPTLTVATAKAADPVMLGNETVPLPLTVATSATISGPAVAVAVSSSVLMPASVGAGSSPVQVKLSAMSVEAKAAVGVIAKT